MTRARKLAGVDEPRATLELWDYRRRVTQIYAAVRRAGPGATALERWKAERETLFRSHPQSAVPPEERSRFAGLRYFPHDPGWRYEVDVEPVTASEVTVPHSAEGSTPLRRFGRVTFDHEGTTVGLTLLWLDTYGGGIFLPFRDETNGAETYGGGRYLLDSAKGADLGHQRGRIVLDFNYAYHPSCVYDEAWSCPLAPFDNHLPVAVRAGERLPGVSDSVRTPTQSD